MPHQFVTRITLKPTIKLRMETTIARDDRPTFHKTIHEWDVMDQADVDDVALIVAELAKVLTAAGVTVVADDDGFVIEGGLDATLAAEHVGTEFLARLNKLGRDAAEKDGVELPLTEKVMKALGRKDR